MMVATVKLAAPTVMAKDAGREPVEKGKRGNNGSWRQRRLWEWTNKWTTKDEEEREAGIF